MMVVRSKIKWFALFVLIMSLAFLLLHLSIAKSSVGLVQYSAMAGLRKEFAAITGSRIIRNRRLWGRVRRLESLLPYANPRVSSYPGPGDQHTLFIYAKIYGGFEKIRPSICDLVAIARLLNATLVIPEIQQSTRAKGISYNFKSFSYLYDEEQFIASLTSDVPVVKSLPNHLKELRKRNFFPTFKPKGSTPPGFYTKVVLPKLRKAKVIGLVLEDGGCLQSLLPRKLKELQRLRCRVAFHALQFRSEIQVLGHRMVERLRAWSQPYLSYHPGLVRETLAYHGCAEIFQDIHTELIQYKRSQMIKKGIVEELNIDSHLQKLNGLCPLMPEEVGIILRGMGYLPKTIIYLAGSELFGGQRVLIPLRAMFPNIVDRTSLCSIEELSDLIGSESPISEDTFQFSPPKSEKQLKEEWDKVGPRPRPLPPPPDRPIYRHEKEGWYSWITEQDTEPDPSPSDLRKEAHQLLWDALDYIVSVGSDAFFPGYNNDGSGWPDFSSLVMGQRLYETAYARTYRPDRKLLTEFLNTKGDSMYILRRNWSLLVQEHLNKSLEVEGIVRQSRYSKPVSFLSHPLPECSCRLSWVEDKEHIEGDDGRVLFGGEDSCPKWMHSEHTPIESIGGGKEETDDENGWEEYENNPVEQPDFGHRSGNTNVTLPFDQDEEMDPND